MNENEFEEAVIKLIINLAAEYGDDLKCEFLDFSSDLLFAIERLGVDISFEWEMDGSIAYTIEGNSSTFYKLNVSEKVYKLVACRHVKTGLL